MRRAFFCGVLAAAVLHGGCGGSGGEEPLLVFAAASLRDVAGDLGAAFERSEGTPVVFNFAGSNTLAQQIRAAPRADVFLSADESWVDFLDEAGHTVPGTRRDVFTNRLVVVAHHDAAYEVSEPRDLAVLGYRFLALADPEAVPAGRYAKAYLAVIPLDGGDLWTAVEGRVAPTLDVRAALALVESDPEILGIVYRTDAATSEKVRVLYELPPRDDVVITYCATLIDGGARPELGRRFLGFLEGPAGREIGARHGFFPP